MLMATIWRNCEIALYLIGVVQEFHAANDSHVVDRHKAAAFIANETCSGTSPSNHLVNFSVARFRPICLFDFYFSAFLMILPGNHRNLVEICYFSYLYYQTKQELTLNYG